MFQIDNDTSSQSLPAPSAAGTPGYFVDGDPAKGIPATILPAEFMNMLMMEFINLVTAAGLAPSKSDYTQLSKAIPALISKLATVDWSKVSNIPTDLLHANTTPALTGVELFGAQPALDFHFGSDAADYNIRLINSTDGWLRLAAKAGPLVDFGMAGISAYANLVSRQVLILLSQGARASQMFYSADGNKLYYSFQHDGTSWTLSSYTDAGIGTAAIKIDRATAAALLGGALEVKGATVLDSTLSVAGKATISGGAAVTGDISTTTKVNVANAYYSPTVLTLRNQSADNSGNVHLWTYNYDGSERALIYFDNTGGIHLRSVGLTDSLSLNAAGAAQFKSSVSAVGRVSSSQDLLSAGAVYAGNGAVYLDTDGNIIGGRWTGGALSTYLANTYTQRANLANDIANYASGAGGIGTYAFCRNGASTLGPGDAVAGTSLSWGSTSSWNGTLSGTWRCLGYAGNGSHTLFIRIA